MTDWILPTRSRANFADSGITIALNKSKDAHQVVFTIRKDVMKAMRWQVGDRVALRIEPNSRTVTLRRHPHGFKLTARMIKAQKAAGRAITCALKLSPQYVGAHNLTTGSVPLAACFEDGEELVMPFPVSAERAA